MNPYARFVQHLSPLTVVTLTVFCDYKLHAPDYYLFSVFQSFMFKYSRQNFAFLLM